MIEILDNLTTDILTLLAIESDIYAGTDIRQWKRHIDFCSRLGQVEYLYDNNILVGFATWFKTDNPNRVTFTNIGKYVVIPLAYIKKEFRNRISIRRLLIERIKKNYILGKLEGIEYILWRRYPDSKDTGWKKLKLLEGGKIKWVD